MHVRFTQLTDLPLSLGRIAAWPAVAGNPDRASRPPVECSVLTSSLAAGDRGESQLGVAVAVPVAAAAMVTGWGADAGAESTDACTAAPGVRPPYDSTVRSSSSIMVVRVIANASEPSALLPLQPDAGWRRSDSQRWQLSGTPANVAVSAHTSGELPTWPYNEMFAELLLVLLTIVSRTFLTIPVTCA